MFELTKIYIQHLFIVKTAILTQSSMTSNSSYLYSLQNNPNIINMYTNFIILPVKLDISLKIWKTKLCLIKRFALLCTGKKNRERRLLTIRRKTQITSHLLEISISLCIRFANLHSWTKNRRWNIQCKTFAPKRYELKVLSSLPV